MIRELAASPAFEEEELAEIYVGRGVQSAVARTLAHQLMAKDALGAHARDELGLVEVHAARPLQAALASASSFTVGAVLPIAVAWLSPRSTVSWTVSGSSLICLAALGAVAARAGGAPTARSVGRVTFWGALAMFITGIVGRLFGTVV